MPDASARTVGCLSSVAAIPRRLPPVTSATPRARATVTKKNDMRPIMTLSLPEMEDPMEQVRYEVDGAVARITIDRPERHNAMSFQVMEELGEAFETAKTDDEVR